MPVIKGIDYYGVLGLTKDAEINDIKQAYRRLAVQYSAKWQQDPEVSKIFCLGGEAYEVLSDGKLRAIYDKYGEGGLKKGVLTPSGWHEPYVYHQDPVRTYRDYFGTRNPYSDLLEEMKSQRAIALSGDGKGPKRKQETQVKPLILTLEEVYNGTMKKMKIVRKVRKENDPDTTELRERMLIIEIKKGLPPGTEILFEGVGDSEPLQEPGDIKYITEDKPHPSFARDGIDLKMTKEVNLTDALGGMIFTINTLDGRILKSRITEIIRPGYVKIIHEEGMPHATDLGTYGDLYITFNVTFPLYIPDVCKSLISKCLNEADELANKKLGGGVDKDKPCKATTALLRMY